MALFRHAADGGVHDLLEHALLHRLAHDGSRGVGPHAAGVLAGVAVEGALVVLGGRQRDDVLSVGDRVVGGLLAREERLDHDLVPGVAEAARSHDLGQGALRGGGSVTDGDSLARREAVGLHHAPVGQPLHVGPGRLEVVEDLEVGRGDVVARHEALRPGLAALEPGRLGGRPEDGEAGFAQPIRDACGERYLGSDHDEVDALHPRQIAQRYGGLDADRGVAARDVGHAVAAGSRVHGRDERALRDLPDERVLATARSDHQDAHAPRPLSAGSGARR
jgi:hypothetical protein